MQITRMQNKEVIGNIALKMLSVLYADSIFNYGVDSLPNGDCGQAAEVKPWSGRKNTKMNLHAEMRKRFDSFLKTCYNQK